MTAKNPDNLWDRIAVLYDSKQRVIDLTDFHQQPPEVGIYDEPVRYFKANKLWCKFIFGWLAWMQNVAFWEEAEDSNYHAIQQILIFEEGIEGGIFMSPDEFKQALRDGLYQWSNDVAKQIVSGRTFGITVDEDGNVTVGGDGDADLPDDDPETPQNEAAEAGAGSAIKLANEINLFYARIGGLFGVDVVPDRPVEEAIEYIENVYMRGESSTAITAAMNEYWTRRAAGEPVVDFLTDLAEWLYCEGFTFEAVRAKIYAQESDIDAADNGSDLLGALDSDWFNHWVVQGASVPSTAYRSYSCVPIEVEQFTLDMSTANNPQYQTAGIWKKGHRFLIEVSGSYADTDNPNLVGDAMYFHNLGTGVKTFDSLGFNSSGGVIAPTQVEVPFSASHVYRFTVDKSPTSADNVCIISRDNGLMAIPNVTGILTIKVTDLGQYS